MPEQWVRDDCKLQYKKEPTTPDPIETEPDQNEESE